MTNIKKEEEGKLLHHLMFSRWDNVIKNYFSCGEDLNDSNYLMSNLVHLFAFLLHVIFIMYFKPGVLLNEIFMLILYQETYAITGNSLLMP